MANQGEHSDGTCTDCGAEGHDGRGTSCGECRGTGWLQCAACDVRGDDCEGGDPAAFMFAGDAWLCKECASDPATVAGYGAPIAPTVHLNGTSGETLRDQLLEAGRAIQTALTALSEAAPNARDYPDRAVYHRARDKHADMACELRVMLDGIIRSADHVMTQLEAREAQKAGR